MKAITLLTLFTLFFCIAYTQKPTDDFSGQYKTEDGNIIIISPNNGTFIGNETKKNLVVLKEVEYKNGKWVAIVTNPVKDKTAKCELYLEGNKLKIIARQGLASKTLYWTKL
jgi:hypothetical protein